MFASQDNLQSLQQVNNSLWLVVHMCYHVLVMIPQSGVLVCLYDMMYDGKPESRCQIFY